MFEWRRSLMWFIMKAEILLLGWYFLRRKITENIYHTKALERMEKSFKTVTRNTFQRNSFQQFLFLFAQLYFASWQTAELISCRWNHRTKLRVERNLRGQVTNQAIKKCFESFLCHVVKQLMRWVWKTYFPLFFENCKSNTLIYRRIKQIARALQPSCLSDQFVYSE